jgi:hypothetical protein
MAFTLGDFFSGLSGANREDTMLKRAQVDEANMRKDAYQRSLKDDEEARIALAQIAQARSTPKSMGVASQYGEQAGGLDGLGGTPSLNAMGQEQPAEMGGMGQTAPQGQSQVAAPTPLKQVFQDVNSSSTALQDINSRAQELRSTADQLRLTGNPKLTKMADEYDKQYTQIIEKVPALEKQALETKVKLAEMTNNVLSGVSDERSLNLAVGQLAQINPNIGRELAQAGLRPSLSGGIAFDANAQTFIKTHQQTAGTFLDRAKQQLAIENAAQNKLDEDERRTEQKRRNAEEEAQGRAKINLQSQELGLKRLDRQDAITSRVTTAVQKEISADPLYKDYDKFKSSHNTAQELAAKLGPKGEGYKNVRPSDLQALRADFQNMISGYRARAGGKYEFGEFDKLNSTIEKLDKYIGSIGSGTPVLGNGALPEVLKTMNTLFNKRNDEVVLEGLKRVGAAEKRGADITGLSLKGDIPSFINADKKNRSVVKDEKGDTYLIVNKNGKQQTIYLPLSAYGLGE